jgi:type IV pilus assembly protein PilM
MGVGVGLDIGTDSVKVVSVRSDGHGTRLLSALRVKRGTDGAFPVDALAQALRSAGVPRKGTAGASGKDTMLRYIPVPPVPPWRLRMLVEFEIRENMAGGGADVSSDYRPLNIAGGVSQGLIVLAAVVKNAYLEERFDLARSSGISISSAAPNAVALYRAYTASQLYKAGETTFLLDIGRENCEMAIQQDGDILFARNTTGHAGDKVTSAIDGAFGIGRDRSEDYKRERARLTLQPPPEGDKRQMVVYGALREAGDTLVGAVNSGLRFARMQTKMQQLDYDKLVLSGGGAKLAGLREFLENRLQKPVVVFDPEAAFESSGLRGASAEALKQGGCGFAVAAGLAVADAARGGFGLSLIPPKEQARRLFWGQTVFAYLAAAAAVVLAGIMFFGVRSDLAAKRDAREQMEAGILQLRDRAGRAEALESANRGVRNGLSLLMEEARVNKAVIEFLSLQRQLCPGGLSFTELELIPSEEPGAVNIAFSGKGVGLAQTAFLDKLEEFRSKLLAAPIVIEATISEVVIPNAADGTRAFKCRATIDPWIEPTPAKTDAGEATLLRSRGARGGA